MELPEHEAATFIPSAGEVLPRRNHLVSTQQPLVGKTNRCLLTPSPAAAGLLLIPPTGASVWLRGEDGLGLRRERVFP